MYYSKNVNEYWKRGPGQPINATSSRCSQKRRWMALTSIFRILFRVLVVNWTLELWRGRKNTQRYSTRASWLSSFLSARTVSFFAQDNPASSRRNGKTLRPNRTRTSYLRDALLKNERRIFSRHSFYCTLCTALLLLHLLIDGQSGRL